MVLNTHVNLMDLEETERTGEPVKIFESEQELSVYTRRKEKYFPRRNALAGGLLRFLLRRILHPPAMEVVRRWEDEH